MKAVRFSALSTGPASTPSGDTPGSHLIDRKGSVMKNLNHTVVNRTRDLTVCSAVPQPTAPPRSGTANGPSFYRISG